MDPNNSISALSLNQTIPTEQETILDNTGYLASAPLTSVPAWPQQYHSSSHTRTFGITNTFHVPAAAEEFPRNGAPPALEAHAPASKTRAKRSQTDKLPYACNHPGCDVSYPRMGELT